MSWIANAWEIFAARPRPRLCKIRKFSSISRFEHESQKKVASLPSLGLDSRPRFSDLSFHSQPWLPVTKILLHLSGDSSVKWFFGLIRHIQYSIERKNLKFFLCRANIYRDMVRFHLFFTIMRILHIRREVILFKDSKKIKIVFCSFQAIIWSPIRFFRNTVPL